MKYTYILSLIILFTSCNNSKPDYTKIEFEAGACFGTCPVFTLDIQANGAAFYTAEMFNKTTGKFKAILNKERLDSLNTLLSDARIESLNDKYAVSYTDAPTYKLTVTMKNGSVNSITDYGPCGPDRLKRLYDFLFSLRQTQKWK